jgi:endonuclease/exonuclease/phosphatase family metal-dependent hydrolase
MAPSVRTTLAGAVSVAVSAALLAALGPTPASQGAAATTASTATTRVGTYNIQAKVSTATFKQAVDAFTPYVDVAGFQEVNNRDKGGYLNDLPGFASYRPGQTTGAQNPVIWRTDRFSLISARSVRISRTWFIGDEWPAGGRYLQASYAAVVRLNDRLTGRPLVLVNVHLVPGAVTMGKATPGRPKMFQLYVRQVANLLELVKAERAHGRVFATGDYNAGWKADERVRRTRLPFMSFRRIYFKSNWATERPARRGTHSLSLIDQVYSVFRASDARVLFSIGYSDHYPGLGTYQLPVAN